MSGSKTLEQIYASNPAALPLSGPELVYLVQYGEDAATPVSSIASVLSLKAIGISANVLLGTLPENAWVLRLLVRDLNLLGGGSIGLGTSLGETDILFPRQVPSSNIYSLTVDIGQFLIGSFALGVSPQIFATITGSGMALSVQLDYELGP